jgi:hypothetical protein
MLQQCWGRMGEAAAATHFRMSRRHCCNKHCNSAGEGRGGGRVPPLQPSPPSPPPRGRSRAGGGGLPSQLTTRRSRVATPSRSASLNIGWIEADKARACQAGQPFLCPTAHSGVGGEAEAGRGTAGAAHCILGLGKPWSRATVPTIEPIQGIGFPNHGCVTYNSFLQHLPGPTLISSSQSTLSVVSPRGALSASAKAPPHVPIG